MVSLDDVRAGKVESLFVIFVKIFFSFIVYEVFRQAAEFFLYTSGNIQIPVL